MFVERHEALLLAKLGSEKTAALQTRLQNLCQVSIPEALVAAKAMFVMELMRLYPSWAEYTNEHSLYASPEEMISRLRRSPNCDTYLRVKECLEGCPAGWTNIFVKLDGPALLVDALDHQLRCVPGGGPGAEPAHEVLSHTLQCILALVSKEGGNEPGFLCEMHSVLRRNSPDAARVVQEILTKLAAPAPDTAAGQLFLYASLRGFRSRHQREADSRAQALQAVGSAAQLLPRAAELLSRDAITEPLPSRLEVPLAGGGSSSGLRVAGGGDMGEPLRGSSPGSPSAAAAEGRSCARD